MIPMPPVPPSIPVEGGGALTPHRIFCVGQNYADHAREMGVDPDKQEPVFFMKPASAAVLSGEIPFPPATENLHYEAELAVILGRGGAFVTPDAAEEMIFGYAAANDLTRRDLQAEAKANGRPWDMAKGFDRSAVFGEIRRAAPPNEAAITCTVNGEMRQKSQLGKMIWSVPQIIARLSRLVELQPCDIILTGTPEGVGPLRPGDECSVEIEGLAPAALRFRL